MIESVTFMMVMGDSYSQKSKKMYKSCLRTSFNGVNIDMAPN
ncbi:hypothetical protein J2T19_002530 [Paenibacillus tundrae]|uniref:Uncharacterized protein n=1 Tax=Paenibacillus tundrae TaxID=528187 RepID=A0ABT9WCW2_9BACL|nr:hypothetical protein [Paenibacillus tundrae]